jgi:hypothetical protein
VILIIQKTIEGLACLSTLAFHNSRVLVFFSCLGSDIFYLISMVRQFGACSIAWCNSMSGKA